MRANLRRTLNTLSDDKAFIHPETSDSYQITRSGLQYVESNGLMET
jgi:hypothetical protein